MKKNRLITIALLLLGLFGSVNAEPTTNLARIISLRVRTNGTTPLVYIQLSSAQLGTDTYTFSPLGELGRIYFSTALDAFHSGKNVKIEVNGCNPCAWGSGFLSLYILE